MAKASDTHVVLSNPFLLRHGRHSCIVLAIVLVAAIVLATISRIVVRIPRRHHVVVNVAATIDQVVAPDRTIIVERGSCRCSSAALG